MLGLLMLAMLSDSGQAHPHVWVTTRTELVFDAQGRLTHLRHLWEFDEAYSAFAVMGLDTNGDGQPDAAGLAESARTNLGSLQEFNYFTAVQIDGVTVAFNAPTEYDQAFTGGRLSLRFLLPLKGPAKPNTLTFKIEDPSFFVALSPTDGPDAVTMGNAPKDCVLTVRRPDKTLDEGAQVLADDITAALSGRLETTSALAADFVGRATVTCS